MKYFITIILLAQISHLYAADVCDEIQPSPLLGKNCIPEDAMMEELPEMMGGPSQKLKSFCNNCKSPLTDLTSQSDEGINEKKISYSKTIIREVQKELTFITTDLLKIRSSFAFSINGKKIAPACNINNLKPKTGCMSPGALESYKEMTVNIQNSLATEVSNILSETSSKSGLFNRENISCGEKGITEKEVLFAKVKYHESLLTPDFISKLKKLKLSKTMTQEELNKHIPGEMRKLINELKWHPLLQSNFSSEKSIVNFLEKIQNSDSSQEIVEKLYSANSTKEYSKELEERCNSIYAEATAALNQLFCQKDKSFAADDLNTIENVVDSKISYLDADKAESKLKVICSHANEEKNTKSLSSIIAKLRNPYSSDLSSMPLSHFKTNAYRQIVGDDKISICRELNAKDDNKVCKNIPQESYCQMLQFINLSRTDPIYKEASIASADDVNNILRSLIGEGLPQKDGKPDANAILFLKNEGILPGGESAPRPPQQDAGSFHRAVASSNNSIKPPTSQAAKAPAPTTPAQPAPTSQTTTSLGDESQDESQGDSQSEASRSKSDSAKTKNSFSAFSDEEQMNLLNRMKPKANNKKPARTAKSGSSNDSDESYSGPAQNFNSPSFTTDQAAAVADNTAVDKSAISQSEGHSGSRAKLDPKKIDKDASFNEAKIQASQNRAPASEITNDTVISLSKTDGGLNKIEIKVPDESVLGKKTPELESKIQDYLDKSGQSLQGAKKGEAFIVKLGKYDIKVSINDYGVYVATCKDKSIHPDYLAFLSRYFTGIKERVSSTETMKKVLIESTSSK